MDTYAVCHEAHVKQHKINQKQNQYLNLQNPDTKKLGVLSQVYCESSSNIGHNFAKREKKVASFHIMIYIDFYLDKLFFTLFIVIVLCMCFIWCVMTCVEVKG